MAQEIYNEMKRLQRRRQLKLASGVAASCSSSSGSEGDTSPPHHSHATQGTKIHHRALFTFKQVYYHIEVFYFMSDIRRLSVKYVMQNFPVLDLPFDTLSNTFSNQVNKY